MKPAISTSRRKPSTRLIRVQPPTVRMPDIRRMGFMGRGPSALGGFLPIRGSGAARKDPNAGRAADRGFPRPPAYAMFRPTMRIATLNVQNLRLLQGDGGGRLRGAWIRTIPRTRGLTRSTGG